MRSRWFDIDGPVHVADHGGTGPPLVLVHGLGGSHVNWNLVAPLLATSFSVTALDLRGFGRTPLRGHTASLDSNRRLITAYVERHAGGHATLMGNSMGGLLSMMTAAERPDLVDGLVLLNPANFIPRRARHDPRLALAGAFLVTPGLGEALLAARYRFLGAERVVRDTLALVARDPSGLAGEIVTAHLELATERGRLPRQHRSFMQAIRSIAWFTLSRRRFFTMVHRISAPTLLVHGRHDRVVSINAARRLAAARPDWTFRPLQQVGHVPQIEAPEMIARMVLDWHRAAVGTERQAS